MIELPKHKLNLPFFFEPWSIWLNKKTLLRMKPNTKTWYHIKHIYVIDGVLHIHPKYVCPPYQCFKPFHWERFLPAQLCPYKFGIKRISEYTYIGDQ